VAAEEEVIEDSEEALMVHEEEVEVLKASTEVLHQECRVQEVILGVHPKDLVVIHPIPHKALEDILHQEDQAATHLKLQEATPQLDLEVTQDPGEATHHL